MFLKACVNHVFLENLKTMSCYSNGDLYLPSINFVTVAMRGGGGVGVKIRDIKEL